jgi:hypothetical protein
VVVAHGLRGDARAALQQVTLLDPDWLTGAVYSLLNSRVVADQVGEFARAQLRTLLDPKAYPEKWHEFILGMMQDPEIGLCFEVPGTDHEHYLIPEALPANEPDYGMWPEDALRFRFSYELLPPGLIPRFIVQAHRNLTDKPTRWRTGVILGAAGCKILVRGDRDRKRIDINVAGPEGLRRSALNIVLDDLDEVHARNPEIGAKGLVPLTEQPEVDVPYDHLLTLERRRGLDHEFDPPGADRPYTVRELLEGVRREPSRSIESELGGAHVPITVGANSQVTIVGGGVHGGEGPVHVGQPATGKTSDGVRAGSSWFWLAVACGVGAIAVAILLWLLPSARWQLIVGGLLGLGVLVFGAVMWMNPALFYRRLLLAALLGGLIPKFGFSLFAAATKEGATGWLTVESAADWAGSLTWAAVVAILVWGDLKQTR